MGSSEKGVHTLLLLKQLTVERAASAKSLSSFLKDIIAAVFLLDSLCTRSEVKEEEVTYM